MNLSNGRVWKVTATKVEGENTLTATHKVRAQDENAARLAVTSLLEPGYSIKDVRIARKTKAEVALTKLVKK